MIYVIIHLVFVYWIDKYNLVRRRTGIIVLNHKMNRRLVRILHWILPLYLISTMIFHKKISVIMFVLLIISFVGKKILERIPVREKKKDKSQGISFWKGNAKYFYSDYKRENPALAGVAQAEYKQKIK